MFWKLILLHFFLTFAVYAQEATQDLLAADQIKSTDFAEFQKNLSLIEQKYSTLSDLEEDYFLLLRAYEAAYSGDTAKSIELTLQLNNTGVDQTIAFRAKALAINSLVVNRRYLEAFTYLEQIINQVSKIEQPLAREQGLLVTAMMYRYVERYEQTIEYTEQIEGEKLRETAICAAKQLRLDALSSAGMTERFLQELDSGLDYCERRGEILWANLIRTYKGKYLLKTGEWQKAKDFMSQYREQAVSSLYPRLIAEFDIILAEANYALGHLNEARDYASRVIASRAGDNVIFPKVTALKILFQLEKDNANYQQALDYHEQYTAAFTAYMDDKSAQQMAYHTAHSEILAQNQKIALLDKDNQLLQLAQEKLKHQATSNQLLIVALAMLVLGLALMAYRSLQARQRFKALAEYDDLTAISNRYHFSVSAKDALNLCQKGQLPAALIVFDLDHFKQINDQYGHAAGDWALRQTVDTCRNFMRNNDVFGRIGGEEFAILLPGCQSDKAHLLADICRDAIKNIDTAASGYEFKLTASFGVTSAELSGYHLTKLIEDADTAMYQAKQQGRNKVQFFQG
jgi:diguanylate cyclase (GGDEF)-like protein